MARAGDHPWPSWFQDSVQHAQLLTNRTLRGYLLSHNAERWPEVVKATLLYGVLCLQRDFPGQPALELAQLHEASRRLHAEAALGAALPRIRSEFQSLEADVGGFLAELDPNRHGGGGSGGRAGQAAAGGGAARSTAPRSLRLTPRECDPAAATAAAAAAATPRAAAPLPRARAKPAPAVYPDWWPKDAAAAAAAARRASTASKQRPPPRLAYSRPPSAPPSVTQDDLPTAAFLLVPPRLSSGGATGRGSSARGSSGRASQAQQGEPKGGTALSKVKLQHAQRLALQRQGQQADQAVQGDASLWHCGRGGDGSGQLPAPDDGPGTAGPVATPSSYDPASVAKWRQHFGL